MIACPECGGSGKIYYDEAGNSVTPKEFKLLPKEERIEEDCERCDGVGEIESDYEPDWEIYDE